MTYSRLLAMCAAVVAVIIPSAILSQSPPLATEAFGVVAPYKLTNVPAPLPPSETGLLRIAPNDTQDRATLRWTIFNAPETSVELEMPFHRPASLHGIGDRELLVAGIDIVSWTPEPIGQGVLCRVRLDRTLSGMQIIIDEVSTLPFMPGSVVFAPEEGFIYATSLDAPAPLLFITFWTGSAEPTLPAGWFPLMDSLAFPPLNRVEDIILTRRTGLPGVSSKSRHMFGSALTLSFPANYRVFLDQGFQTEMLDSITVSPGEAWIVTEPVAAHDSDIHVILANNQAVGPFSVVDEETLATVATGEITTPGTEVVVSPPAVFLTDPGRSYHVEGPSANPSTSFLPIARYGEGVDIPEIRGFPGSLLPYKMFVGNATFALGSLFELPTEPQAPVDIVVGFAIGHRDEVTGVDPITQTVLPCGATATVLVFDAITSFPVTTSQQIRPVFYNLPVPDDPLLAGSVFFFQFAFLEPGGCVTVSDVFGSTVLPSASSSAQSAVFPEAASATPEAESARHQMREKAKRKFFDQIRKQGDVGQIGKLVWTRKR